MNLLISAEERGASLTQNIAQRTEDAAQSFFMATFVWELLDCSNFIYWNYVKINYFERNFCDNSFEKVNLKVCVI